MRLSILECQVYLFLLWHLAALFRLQPLGDHVHLVILVDQGFLLDLLDPVDHRVLEFLVVLVRHVPLVVLVCLVYRDCLVVQEVRSNLLRLFHLVHLEILLILVHQVVQVNQSGL